MYGYVMAAYQEGLISEEDIRTACVHLFTTRMRLGMFNEKTPYDDIPYDVVDCEEHRRLNYEIACRSMVLLKNDGVLPLDKKKIQNIAVIGPNANEVAPLIGNYHGTPGYYITLLQGITEALPDARVWFAQGSHLYLNHIEDIGPEGDGLAEAKTLCEQADAVVLAVGLTEAVEGEEMGDQNMVGDKATLYLPEGQRALIRTVCDSGKPVILVNFSGSAIDFEYGNEHANAIIQAWYPGALGGRAVAELIFGEYSPSGKLPVTFYPEENSLPDFEDYSMENRTYKFYKENPLYPFGYGLSYSHFLFSDIVLSAEKVKAGDSILCTVTVTNTGKMEAEEVVEFYIRDQEASVRVPRHKLCGIQRVSLKPQESCRITVEIGPEAMQITDEQGCYRYESGNFTVFAGGCQPDPYSQHLYGSSCVQAEFELLV